MSIFMFGPDKLIEDLNRASLKLSCPLSLYRNLNSHQAQIQQYEQAKAASNGPRKAAAAASLRKLLVNSQTLSPHAGLPTEAVTTTTTMAIPHRGFTTVVAVSNPGPHTSPLVSPSPPIMHCLSANTNLAVFHQHTRPSML
ncbi:hypothetical protein EV182_002435 [Spiromyces aspiralis]|uniref:Uncharacterized protein n=1 Tax=Spiromyces aspiralis TaxID=68401 RepID=A0ACC1HE55_9FUNG|nr:hypothetical protein EV182_002435 [Spiromyces aspiralis]